MIFKRLLLVTMFSLFIAALGQSFGAQDNMAKQKNIYTLLDQFSIVLKTVKKNYVKDVSYEKLIRSAMRGMLRNLDPHSDYLAGKTLKKTMEDTSGKFAGVGMVIQKDQKTQYIIVVSPIDNTPAFRAGIKPGDLIIKINNTATDSLSAEESANLLRGKPDTSVKITIWRKTQNPFHVTLKRAIIKIPSVKSSIKGNAIGYIRLSVFQRDTADDLRRTIRELNSKTDNRLRGYILDLRSNPGGLLSSAVGVADTFLPKGKKIVSIRGRNTTGDQDYFATTKDYIAGKPLVVLVNHGSASASEIVTGALKDNKRALIVGQRTFGKGSVQTILSVSNDAAIKFTTALYYTPNGKSIQKLGIEPNIPLKILKVQREVTVPEYSERSLKGALSNPQKKKTQQAQGKITGDAKVKDLNFTDYILARGINILNALIFADIKNWR